MANRTVCSLQGNTRGAVRDTKTQSALCRNKNTLTQQRYVYPSPTPPPRKLALSALLFFFVLLSALETENETLRFFSGFCFFGTFHFVLSV